MNANAKKTEQTLNGAWSLLDAERADNKRLRAQVAALTEQRDEFRSLWELECDMHGKTFAEHKEQVSKLTAALKKAREALSACDEAMGYMSEYDIPLCLPECVKDALAAIDAELGGKGGTA